MSKKPLLIDSVSIKIALEEDGGGRLIASGPFGYVDKETSNRRIYPRAIIEKNLNRLIEDMQKRRVYGELDHPGDGKTKLSRSSHLIVNAEIDEDGTVIGRAEILDTRMGEELKKIVNAGGAVGISSRGYGSVKKRSDGVDIVQDDYLLMTWDFVADPAAGGSYPDFSVETEGEGEEMKNKADSQTTSVVAQEEKPVDTKNIKTEAVEVRKVPELSVDVDRIKEECELRIKSLKESFKAEILSKIATMKNEEIDRVRSEVLSDPRYGGAMQALESVKDILRPYIIEADTNKEIVSREDKIKELGDQLEAMTTGLKKKDVELSEFAAVTKELGFKLFVEGKVGRHAKRDEILQKVGDVNAYGHIEDLTVKVESIMKDYKEVENQINDVKTESNDRVAKLENKLVLMEDQLKKALEIGKSMGVRAYLQQRVLHHPKADEILSEAKVVEPATLEEVHALLSKYRGKSETVNGEGYRSRLRRTFAGNAVDDSLKGTTMRDLRESTNKHGGSSEVEKLTGSTAAEIARLSGLK